ncbi:ATP-binding cassette domain-containing protein [Sphingomonas canadensis]|uniref:ATP-binding cassette domain-containing protein n=1 Tax=Sphingomonas canadensis TaxID=1219257 RepID=A0ABW3H1L8_9SPHN
MSPPLLPEALAACAAPWRGTRRLAVAAGLTVGFASVGLLAISGWFLTAAAIAGGTGPAAARAFNYLVPSAMIRLLAILRTAARYFERLLSHRAALSTLASVRTLLFARAAAAEGRGTLRLSGGEAAALLGQDVDQLEDRLVRGPALAGALAGGGTAIGLAALAGPFPALAVAVCLGGAAWITRRAARRMLPARAEAAAAALTGLKIALTEYAAAAGEIAVYRLTGQVSAELERLAERHDRALRDLAVAEAAIGAAIPAAAGLASALAIAKAGGGPAMAAIAALAAAAIVEAVAALARAEIRAPSIDSAAPRLEALAGVPDAAPPPPAPARPVLTIDAGNGAERIAPGGRVAILGASGSGKTRLIETLAGLRRDAPQRLALGGEETPAAALGLAVLRQCFALVPQEPMLIAGTVLDNLRIARPGIAEPEIWEALAAACIDAEIRALPGGLDQWIGEGGTQLSGGQRKRLALARGLLAGRPWLLLDEPSEGLDAATEARLVAALKAWLDRTGQGLVLASHRPAPLALCDHMVRL